MNVSASTSGTWTIGMNINVEALKSFGAGGSRQQPTNGNYSNTGNVLFMATGDGYYEAQLSKKRSKERGGHEGKNINEIKENKNGD